MMALRIFSSIFYKISKAYNTKRDMSFPKNHFKEIKATLSP